MNRDELLDRAEIQELMNRYAWMVDMKKWEMIDEVFTSDATVDYVSSGGQAGPYKETLGWLARALAPWPMNLHYLSNLHIEFDGDTATSRCYFNAPMGRDEPDGSQTIMTNAGWYEDRLRRTPDGWRIVDRICKQTMMIGGLPEGYEIPS